MKLQTQIPLDKAREPMDYLSRVVLLGSCFSENIAGKLGYFKFRSVSNPFGILFHSKAIEQLVERSVRKEYYSAGDVFCHNGRWHCLDAHSELSANSKNEILEKLNTNLNTTLAELSTASHIIVTLGTAWAYRDKKSDRLVANCHKLPQKEFSKELISMETNLRSLRNIIGLVGTINKKVQFIFTVSPVRHLKDGFVENQRSKANLISALQALQEVPVIDDYGEGENVHYFPSYEIMMDELRDYRFYDTDMVHLNTLAVDCIWEKFKYVWISEAANPVMARVDQVQRGMQHRAFNPCSDQHMLFLEKQRQKIKELQQEYPFMKF